MFYLEDKIMSSLAILEQKIAALPENCINEVLDFVDFLVAKSTTKKEEKSFHRKAGIAKDSDFYMAPDFDAPLECFKDYM
jgi:hypothetical protein